jgi:hypothetical protein
MGLQWSIVEAYEVHNTRRENWNFVNPSATVVLMTTNENRYFLIDDLLRNRRPYPFNGPELPKLYAKSISTLTDKARYTSDDDEQVIDYTDDTFITVTYEPVVGRLYDVTYLQQFPAQTGVLYVEEGLTPEIDFISFDYRKFRWKWLSF